MSNDWLQQLKPGDTVIVDSGPYLSHIAVVSRVTPTQIVIGDSRYNKKRGELVGASSWNRCYLREPLPERVEQVTRKKLISQLLRLDERRLKRLDTDTLKKAVYDLHENVPVPENA